MDIFATEKLNFREDYSHGHCIDCGKLYPPNRVHGCCDNCGGFIDWCEHWVRKPKYKFCKSGTVIVSCKGSGHRCWYRNRTEAEIEDCLRNFCHSCDHRQPDCEVEGQK